MTGIVLAGVLILLLALNGALLALWARKERLPAPQTRKRHVPEYVTPEMLDEAIAEATKQLTFEWNEWYEKFDKLHLRLSKREKRAQRPEPELELEHEEPEERVSVVHLRRLGSV
jgi:hypothetical protein